MRISEIQVTRKKNLGNYENLDLSFTVVIEEGESASKTIDQAIAMADWKVNFNEREAYHPTCVARIAEIEAMNGEADEKTANELVKLRRWLDKYNTLKASVDAFEEALQ